MTENINKKKQRSPCTRSLQRAVNSNHARAACETKINCLFIFHVISKRIWCLALFAALHLHEIPSRQLWREDEYDNDLRTIFRTTQQGITRRKQKKAAETTCNRLIRYADARFICKDAWTATRQQCPNNNWVSFQPFRHNIKLGCLHIFRAVHDLLIEPLQWPTEEITKSREENVVGTIVFEEK